MFYESDLHVAMNGIQLQWVGGVNVYDDETKANQVTRFAFLALPYDYLDSDTNKTINDMDSTELDTFKSKLQQVQLNDPVNAKFLVDYEDAKSKGLY